jgi:hypothetical protein
MLVGGAARTFSPGEFIAVVAGVKTGTDACDGASVTMVRRIHIHLQVLT